MASLKEVKGRIQSVISTQQITKAMKMVAAAKLRRAQDRITQMRPYSQKLTAIIRNVATGVETREVENPYSIVREINRVLIVVVSSDRGLCGAFNSNAFKYTRMLIERKYQDIHRGGGVTIMPIGKKSYDHFSKRGYQIISDYYQLFSDLTFDQVRKAAEYVMAEFQEENFDRVEIVYNEFKNVATQLVVSEQFLPLESEPIQGEEPANPIDFIFEPSREFIFTEIIPKSLKIQFYKTLLESNASEHGARMTAMDKATDNAQELLKELRLTYNRTRQAAITKEILEIVGGAEALSNH